MLPGLINFTELNTLFGSTTLRWTEQLIDNEIIIKKSSIHLWSMELAVKNYSGQIIKILSLDERKRAEDFKFESNRNLYILRKWAIRSVLAKYLGIQPGKIHIDYTERGKPFVEPSQNKISIKFSSSSSGPMWLMAVNLNNSIGIDIENISRPVECKQIASGFFPLFEARQVLSLSGTEQAALFFSLWTAKEAYLKSVGLGLCDYIKRVCIPFQGQKIPLFFAFRDPLAANTAWSGYCFFPMQKHIATLIWEG